MGNAARAGLIFAMVALALAGQLVEREFAGRRREAAREKKSAPAPYQDLLAPLPDASLPSPRGGALGPAAAPQAEAARRTYVTQPGDTLSRIAKRFYGSEGAWNAIYEANRAAIPDPAKLQVGTTLKMPPDRASRP